MLGATMSISTIKQILCALDTGQEMPDTILLTRRPLAQRSAALRAWRQTMITSGDSHSVDSTREGQSKLEGLLIVDNTFGGLSNRRQSLMFAAVAAKLMR